MPQFNATRLHIARVLGCVVAMASMTAAAQTATDEPINLNQDLTLTVEQESSLAIEAMNG